MATDREIRKYVPAYDPINTREPSRTEKRTDEKFMIFINQEIKIESDLEMTRRDQVLDKVRTIFINWVKFIAIQVLHMPEEVAEEAGGELFVSGSHKLGVRDIGADIDTVCVAPNFCTRDHFFTYLKVELEKRPEVTNLLPVETARVPVISFDFQNVSIDLLFCRFSSSEVPRNLDILDDNCLIGLEDESDVLSLNGPRVTEMIFKLVGKQSFDNFLIVLRFVRKWAKKRGIYGNKMGYLGGVNFNILVAFMCQLYPNYGPTSLLFRFFKQYAEWVWPEPILLNNIQQQPPGGLLSHPVKVWLPQNEPNDIMPIITPAYPASNSSYNVSEHSLAVMREEFQLGYDLIANIIKDQNLREDPEIWKELLDNSTFFVKYRHYLACHIIGVDDSPASHAWEGYVEARLRRIPTYYLGTLPYLKVPIHLHPVQSKTQKSDYSSCYFIGFNVNLEALQEAGKKEINIDDKIGLFQDSLFAEYNGDRTDGLDFYVEHLRWKELPKEVFQIYGGYEEAKKLRKRILEDERLEVESFRAALAEGKALSTITVHPTGTTDTEMIDGKLDGGTSDAMMLVTDDKTTDKLDPTRSGDKRQMQMKSNNIAMDSIPACLLPIKRIDVDGLPSFQAIQEKMHQSVALTKEEMILTAKRCRIDNLRDYKVEKKARKFDVPYTQIPSVVWILQEEKKLGG
jgi:poly(A) polymerase